MATRMAAMQLDRPGLPLRLVERAVPQPGPGQVLVAVAALGRRHPLAPSA